MPNPKRGNHAAGSSAGAPPESNAPTPSNDPMNQDRGDPAPTSQDRGDLTPTSQDRGDSTLMSQDRGSNEEVVREIDVLLHKLDDDAQVNDELVRAIDLFYNKLDDDAQTLSSSNATPGVEYAAGILIKNQLHLIPIDDFEMHKKKRRCQEGGNKPDEAKSAPMDLKEPIENAELLWHGYTISHDKRRA